MCSLRRGESRSPIVFEIGGGRPSKLEGYSIYEDFTHLYQTFTFLENDSDANFTYTISIRVRNDMTATLASILRIPELLDQVLEQSGTTIYMSKIHTPLGYRWNDYSITEYINGSRLLRQNIVSVIQCLSRDFRMYGLRWMNPGCLTTSEKNTIFLDGFLQDFADYDSVSDYVSHSDSESEMLLDDSE